MANIRVNLDYPISDGLPLTFKAPCPCSETTGLIVYYPAAIGSTSILSKVFTFKDAHCNDLTGLGNLFTTNAYVKVILNTRDNAAYIQNGDTNAYLEGKFDGKASVEVVESLTQEVSNKASSDHNHDGVYATASHTQAASTITAGTFSATGVVAKSGTDYTTARVRNIKASTTDLTAGTSSLTSGDLYFVYE